MDRQRAYLLMHLLIEICRFYEPLEIIFPGRFLQQPQQQQQGISANARCFGATGDQIYQVGFGPNDQAERGQGDGASAEIELEQDQDQEAELVAASF
ncbi:unnamed protein product [Protopolystoma xenopodis]|uniref:Uncharacterized protein n=1 Tax=Protopolystoma xenopodis TaxID=117903 RepID=A0A448XFQ1_9PLAT|nr:unnamed protein product [Protopolystoma xenopodis]